MSASNCRQQQNILVVEDSPTQAQMLKSMLEELDMKIDIAGSLSECFESLKHKHYDAVMLDLILPDCAGIETLMSLAPKHPSIPIVVLTSLEEESLGFEALKAGAEDYLVKGNVSPRDLSRTLRYAIERKRQSHRMYENERRLRTTIDNSYDAFLSLDQELKIIEWNSKAEDMFGYSAVEAIGSDLAKTIFSTKEGLEILSKLKRFYDGEESDGINTRCEVMAKHRGGRDFPVELAFFPVEEGGETHVCTFVSDISNRKEIERQMSDFYSNVSHELRTPLTSIRASLGLMEGGVAGALPPKANKLVAISTESCDRLIRLVGDLLDLTKFEAGQMPLKYEELNLAEIVDTAVRECYGAASLQSVRVVQEVDSSFRVNADKDRILQVIINLLSNAIKFSPEASIVTLSAKRVAVGKVRLSVKDEGPGIVANDMGRLFQKFQQLQATEHTAIKGTGLGLVICKAIVSHHRGDIGVENNNDKGATFWFELPLQKSD